MKGMVFTSGSVYKINQGSKTVSRRVVKRKYDACLSGDCPHAFRSDCAASLLSFCRYKAGDIVYVKQTLFVSDCGEYVCRTDGDMFWDVFTADGKIHFQKPVGDKPPKHCVDSYSATKYDQPKGTFNLGICECNPRKKIKAFTGNTVLWKKNVAFRKKKSPWFMPLWAAGTFLRITNVRAENLQEIKDKDIEDEGVDISNGRGGKIGSVFFLDRFKTEWDKINPLNPWESNPWVYVYTFEKIEKSLVKLPPRHVDSN